MFTFQPTYIHLPCYAVLVWVVYTHLCTFVHVRGFFMSVSTVYLVSHLLNNKLI